MSSTYFVSKISHQKHVNYCEPPFVGVYRQCLSYRNRMAGVSVRLEPFDNLYIHLCFHHHRTIYKFGWFEERIPQKGFQQM